MSAHEGLSGHAAEIVGGPLLTRSGPEPVQNPAVQHSMVCYPSHHKDWRHCAVKRREFITVFGGAMIWPLLARAEQASKLPRVGYLSDEARQPSLFHSQVWILKWLGDRGYADGRNIAIEYRYAAGKPEQLPSLAAELAALHVDLIVAVGTPAAKAAIAATKTIPIIFCRIGDAVGYGLVTSLAHPGGNATGATVFTVELAEKRIEVLKDQVPGLDRLAVIHDPTFLPGQIELKQITAAASALKIQVHAVPVREPTALEAAFPDVMRWAPQALFVGSAAWHEEIPRQIVDFALRTRLPAVYIRREWAEIGGIMSYAVSYRDMYRDAAYYIDRVLKGAKPGDLPVLQPTRIELVINLKSARALGLIIAPPLVARADDVIE